jgi:hypothetical protein
MSVTIDGDRIGIGFIEHLQNVTTSIAIAISHTAAHYSR